MHVQLDPALQGTPDGEEGKRLLGRCVHCGFCLAACPTYRLLGDELDSPRGRLYLVKGLLEGAPASEATRLHLDRCLTCRACETACPSGVEYAKVLEIGRQLARARVPRSLGARMVRRTLRGALSRPRVFGSLLRAGRVLHPLLPRKLAAQLGTAAAAGAAPVTARAQGEPAQASAPLHRRVLVLAGCVQPALAPDIHLATRRVLAAIGIEAVVPAAAGWCGAVRQHLDDPQGALAAARRNIDAWWPWIEGPGAVEAVVSDASGCGVQLADYGYLLRHDSAYADKAKRVSELARDLIEVVEPEVGRLADQLSPMPAGTRLAFHSPCTLQHGQRLGGRVEEFLRRLGADVPECTAADQCCGAAGTYALLQPALSNALRERKWSALQACRPDEVVSANASCLTHLRYASTVPMRHWVEWVAARLSV